jgi:hypothetical protein
VLTLHVPMLLALLGTALMAVVIFAPTPSGAAVTVSLAPPRSPAPAEHWSPPPVEHWNPPPPEHWSTAPVEHETLPPPQHWSPPPAEPPPAPSPLPGWPALVDPGAAGCDTAARLALADALGAVRGPWADAILTRALDDETDPVVRDAIASALGASRC